ncbi:MAG: hypothetical protein IJ190_07615, partial [Prevotella sp.]|nr:hypothetical protein [Prevotella sp.]
LFALLIDFSSPQDSDNLIATLRERLSPAERESISTPKKLHFYLESLEENAADIRRSTYRYQGRERPDGVPAVRYHLCQRAWYHGESSSCQLFL